MSKIVECESTNGDPSDVVVCATILNGILPENYQMSVTILNYSTIKNVHKLKNAFVDFQNNNDNSVTI